MRPCEALQPAPASRLFAGACAFCANRDRNSGEPSQGEAEREPALIAAGSRTIQVPAKRRQDHASDETACPTSSRVRVER